MLRHWQPQHSPQPCCSPDAAARTPPAAAPEDEDSAPPPTRARGPAPRTNSPSTQSTPGLAAASYFTAVGDARFGDACAVLAPVVRARYASAGQDCQTALAELFDEPTRAAIGQVAADDGVVETTGDTALIPGTALSRTDLPDGADRPDFPDVRASRQGGLWYLVL